MRLNENTVLFGDRIILVPYRAEHVPTYHEWMKSPELLELTASEPLSYEEELDMQRKWHLDEDKLTFILLERPPSLSSTAEQNQKVILPSPCLAQCRMVGDVNLFLPEGLEGDGECEIMIASKEDRRKRFAIEALSLFLSYLTTTLPLPATHLIARIGASNLPSIHLFRKLGFGVVKHVQVFDEVELRWGAKDVECLGLEGLEEVTAVDWRETSLHGRIGVYDA
ncbi:hypothetical protein C343_02610 [Cryptococcus neoformans C23]|uniref:N-acetyltransferase 9-like protein n=1 Tax=Cryptococcus neoformans (strain H99 / ATCC 208821 / CBS 10515 / FGSC 9487) TaxID=235443 RepID=J9VM75_CRYN9|nr:hypothetical protein CNAG_05268 [Cryptococcus neoformans var. grubii H99]AUB24190.1 hypothetical protein CKF44_05268 [Cryptococcus neoformans var. grubii]OWZ32882.1 hypothetical protein C347_02678 [Cryptococcus neoformans var. grubii AD2-60a]OWZ44993.1 hypothetical protein C343_02610 [Cryptococcus neoformans var. grubii C23]OWZ45865.1 hypothetical protein C353_02513 [Cryptococcus neoformans var. grubii AD1-83a]OWZ54878.1 hypothetical protein C368_03106 [Cryptococcus neoformans var. grubii 1|eukprot:XP_012048564.1 hypothetical protein CNAG_05268 [Cryptococcus neoformans var. grubii H99]